MNVQGIDIREGHLYYIGVTHSPRQVLVTRIHEPRTPGRAIVDFEEVPIDQRDPQAQPDRMDTAVFASMVRSGSMTKREQLEQFVRARQHHGHAAPAWAAESIESLNQTLAGQPGPPTTRLAASRLIVEVISAGDDVGDLWGLIDALTGGCCNGLSRGAGPNAEDVYECTAFGTDGVAHLCTDPNLTVLGVKWGGIDVTDEVLTSLDMSNRPSPRPSMRG